MMAMTTSSSISVNAGRRRGGRGVGRRASSNPSGNGGKREERRTPQRLRRKGPTRGGDGSQAGFESIPPTPRGATLKLSDTTRWFTPVCTAGRRPVVVGEPRPQPHPAPPCPRRTPTRTPSPAFRPLDREGLTLASRRNLLKAGLAGVAGRQLPGLLRRATRRRPRRAKSVILLWMTGGPSQIDTWDPKPDRPAENRGPFGVTQTKLPGVIVCEHLPKLAAMLDRFTLIRSVDCRHSNHEPNTVLQTGNRSPSRGPTARRAVPGDRLAGREVPRAEPPGDARPTWRSCGRGRTWPSAGYLGKQYDPFLANDAARLPVYDLVGKDSGQVSGRRRSAAGRRDPRSGWPTGSRCSQNFDRLRATSTARGDGGAR